MENNMAYQTVDLLPGQDFGIVYDFDEHPQDIVFRLHYHADIYEVLLLLQGDCVFHVEGNSYPLHPSDIVVACPLEFHKMAHLSDHPYERIILYFKHDFFVRHDCERFLSVFEQRPLGTGNLVSAESSHSKKELTESFQRLLNYASHREYMVADHGMVEFLYWLNMAASEPFSASAADSRIHKVVLYINNHLTEPLVLDLLATEFGFSKYYLCKLFKENTGLTIQQYITQKRLLLSDSLHAQGQNWLSASLDAGFHDYSVFYRAYKKNYGTSPRG